MIKGCLQPSGGLETSFFHAASVIRFGFGLSVMPQKQSRVPRSEEALDGKDHSLRKKNDCMRFRSPLRLVRQ